MKNGIYKWKSLDGREIIIVHIIEDRIYRSDNSPQRQHMIDFSDGIFMPMVALTPARVTALRILLDPDFADATDLAQAHVTILAMLREAA